MEVSSTNSGCQTNAIAESLNRLAKLEARPTATEPAPLCGRLS